MKPPFPGFSASKDRRTLETIGCALCNVSNTGTTSYMGMPVSASSHESSLRLRCGSGSIVASAAAPSSTAGKAGRSISHPNSTKAPVPRSGLQHVQLPADLRQSDIRDLQFLRQLGRRQLPNPLIHLLSRDLLGLSHVRIMESCSSPTRPKNLQRNLQRPSKNRASSESKRIPDTHCKIVLTPL